VLKDDTTVKLNNIVIYLCIDVAGFQPSDLLPEAKSFFNQYNSIGQLSRLGDHLYRVGEGSDLGAFFAKGSYTEDCSFTPDNPQQVAVKGNRMMRWRVRAVDKPEGGFTSEVPPAAAGWIAQFKCLGYKAHEDFYKQFTLVDDWRGNTDAFYLLVNRFKGAQYAAILHLCHIVLLTGPDGAEYWIVWEPEIQVETDEGYPTLH